MNSQMNDHNKTSLDRGNSIFIEKLTHLICSSFFICCQSHDARLGVSDTQTVFCPGSHAHAMKNQVRSLHFSHTHLPRNLFSSYKSCLQKLLLTPTFKILWTYIAMQMIYIKELYFITQMDLSTSFCICIIHWRTTFDTIISNNSLGNTFFGCRY